MQLYKIKLKIIISIHHAYIIIEVRLIIEIKRSGYREKNLQVKREWHLVGRARMR